MTRLLLIPLLALACHAASQAVATNVTVTRLLVSGAVPPASTPEFTLDTIPVGATNWVLSFVTIQASANTNDPELTLEVSGGVGEVPYAYRILENKPSRGQMEALIAAYPELSYFKTRRSDGVNQDAPYDAFEQYPLWDEDTPAMHACVVQRLRLVNWLNVKCGYQPAYNFDALGNWLLWDAGDGFVDARGENRIRHKDAFYFLPSLDEWHKAVYWDFVNQKWWKYPFGSDSAPSTCHTCTTASSVSLWDLVGGEAGQVAQYALGPSPIEQSGGVSLNGLKQIGNCWDVLETTYDINDATAPLNASVSNDGDYWVAVRGGKWFYGYPFAKSNYMDQERPYGAGGTPTLPYGLPLNDSSGLRLASKVLP